MGRAKEIVYPQGIGAIKEVVFTTGVGVLAKRIKCPPRE